MLIRPLSTELQKKSEAELHEVASRVEEDLEHIKEWHEKQAHLSLRTEAQWLITFLRGCKFSLQRTKEKLDFFYTLRALVPEFFENRDPLLPEIQETLKVGSILPLPRTADPAAPRILLYRWGVADPQTVTYTTIVKTYCMCMDVLMNEDDNSVVAGVQIIVDLKGFSAGHALQCTPSILKKSILCVEKAYPIRIKKIDCMYSPAIFDTVYNISKTFLSEKLNSRISIHTESKFENVFQSISKSLLPEEYGGQNGSVNELVVEWKKKVESYREWFLDDAKYRSNEQLRLGKPKTSADVFGIEGSFRKLNID